MRTGRQQEVLKEETTHDAELAEQFAQAIGHQAFGMWFPHSARLSTQGSVVKISTDSAFLRDLVQSNMDSDLRTSARAILGPECQIQYEVRGQASSAAQMAKPSTPALSAASPCPADSNCTWQHPPTNPAASPRVAPPGESFADFAVCDTNRFAYEVGRQVALRGTMGTPVTLVGPCGSGKTHLLLAIRSEFRRRFPKARCLLISAEDFTTNFLGALSGGGLPSFRQKHRGVDLLIVDNLSFFLGKRATIEELQYTIDRVLSAGGQVVFAANRPLTELGDLGSEVISRCASGLVCEVGLPDRGARKAIIANLFASHGTQIDDDVIDLLASGLATGVREIMGVVNRLATQHRLLGDAIDRTLAERVVGQANRHIRRPVKLDDIQRAVSDFFGVEPKALRSDDRHKSVSQPRMLAMWLARKYTQSAWREIGSYFGGRSHSTVISAHRRVEKQLSRAESANLAGHPWPLHEAIERIEAVLRTG